MPAKTAASRQAEKDRARTVALFQSIGDGIVATNERGIITDVNQAALNILGYKKNELMGKWFPEAIQCVNEDGEIIDLIDRPVSLAMLTGKPVNANMLYVTKLNTVVPVSINVSPVMIGNRPHGVIEIFRDISHEHEVDRMKSEFISIASHQLRTPLSAIKTYAHMLEGGFSGKMNKQQRQFLNIILDSVERMNDLINTLLDLSRIEEGKLAIATQFVNLEALTEEVIAELMPAAKAKKQTVKVNYESDDLNASTDPLMVREVCSNLLSNSIKYTQVGGKIEIFVSASPEYFEFMVKDNGYGIPDKEQERVFSKFFRAENIMDKDTTGTGLGLYLVKKIAEGIEGKIEFTSKEGKGSQFIFKLPRKIAVM